MVPGRLLVARRRIEDRIDHAPQGATASSGAFARVAVAPAFFRVVDALLVAVPDELRPVPLPVPLVPALPEVFRVDLEDPGALAGLRAPERPVEPPLLRARLLPSSAIRKHHSPTARHTPPLTARPPRINSGVPHGK